MANFVPISRERHGNKKWRRPDAYGFAATLALAPVVGMELGSIGLSIPLAFVEQAGRHLLVAVLSLGTGRNMFVGPSGQWLGPYIPAVFRAYPFQVLPRPGSEEGVMCVDEDSGLIVEHDSVGETFFDEAGQVAPALQAPMQLCSQLERSRRLTENAVAALSAAGVIRPWQIRVKGKEGDREIAGLHQTDEAALNALDDGAFLNLRRKSALPIAYTQILSAGNLGVFERLAQVQSQLAPRALPESLNVAFGVEDDGMIHF